MAEKDCPVCDGVHDVGDLWDAMGEKLPCGAVVEYEEFWDGEDESYCFFLSGPSATKTDAPEER